MSEIRAARASLAALAASVMLGASCASISVRAETGTVPSEGVADRPSRHVLLTHARIVVEPGRVIDDGSIELRDGRIHAVHDGVPQVPGTAHRDLRGKTVFAGFIDAAARVGLPEDMRAGGIKPLPAGQAPHQTSLDQPGAHHWNRRVRSDWSVAGRLDYKPEEAKLLRALGFSVAYATPEAGVVKGRGALLSLRESSQDKDVVLARDRMQHFGFELAGGFSSEYPGSLMGAIALIRQSLYDARWWQSRDRGARVEDNPALPALTAVTDGEQRVSFQLDDELDVQRVSRLVREFGLDAYLVGTGTEYRVLPALRAARLPIVLPLGFPEAPHVEDAEATLNATLAELQHWEQAPANAARVKNVGVDLAISPRGTKDPDKNFWNELRRAVRAGLDEDDALAALTTAPARLLGESLRLGRIAPGQLANLVVADADLFRRDGASVYETWVEGERYELKPIAEGDALGEWSLSWSDGRGPARIRIEGEGDVLDVHAGDVKFKAKRDGARIVALPPNSLFTPGDGSGRLTFVARGDAIEGFRDGVDGRRVRFTGARAAAVAAATKKDKSSSTPDAAIPEFRGYPAGEFARVSPPAQPPVLLVRGATLWTNSDQGVIEGADLLVKAGRISAIGEDLQAPSDALVIDARGRHVTAGIVDAHSHTAVTRNVNEPSHAVTTEVRVADALDPTDIDLYRQLAGGVTSANLLHGSANPMGGQNAVIKLRWGADADGLLFQGAAPGVKFALGENVKQSGWGDAFVSRYPQTRMGVEQIMRDHFNAARDYAARRAGKQGERERRDLRLEALAEILAGKRLVHVHSYRQDEILMFARLAREFDLPVATFQHVLEGYKVADEIAALNAGGSTFADWWGYKMEVIDGIPHNGALMARAGVVTSFNSDSNEMARRLNMEATKAVRYGGLDEQEALKLVTLNPARQLRIDDRVGSLESGKDADFVIWSDHPLSNFARAEQTWIDGRRYFDRDEDRKLHAELVAERERLIQKALLERTKSLELAEAAKADRDEPDAKPDTITQQDEYDAAHHAHWLSRQVVRRGLYHSGADLSSCSLHDHAH
jgi:imidazolonepropionase-like amidohydrolase